MAAPVNDAMASPAGYKEYCMWAPGRLSLPAGKTLGPPQLYLSNGARRPELITYISRC